MGYKNEDGTFSIIAHGSENCISCVRRGNIYNFDETANHINNLIINLESQLSGCVIDKIYIGIGGQSLQAVNHIEHKKIKKDAIINVDDLLDLLEQCLKNKTDSLRMIDIAQTIYYVDGEKETCPVGLFGKVLEGHFKLILCRESVSSNIKNCFQKIERKGIAGIFASPQSLAEVALSDNDKELGVRAY